MIDHPVVWFGLVPLGAYLVGSVPWGVLLARSQGVDLRRVGSGNVGATNVSRALGRRWGYLCFLLDLAKGFVPVVLAGWLLGAIGSAVPSALQQLAWLLAGSACILGHVFSLFLRFRGGKGVATSLGVVLGMVPYFTWPGLGAFGVWIVAVLISRYVSLASIVAAGAFLALLAGFNLLAGGVDRLVALWPMELFAAVMAGLVIVRHRSNIRRLLDGTEGRIGSA
jgi:glycerol-3-phosphate acyltransferase PlsY